MRLLLAAFLLAFAGIANAVGMPSGLGASTYTCLDIDGDGYGVGPGCTGPDADDNDSTVHTGAAAIAAHGGTLTSFLAYKGYTPTRIWYLATTGNDSTGAVNDVTKPFANYSAIRLSVQAGDAVIMRDGWNGVINPPVNGGSAGSPILYMSYPGELAVIDGSIPVDGLTGGRVYTTERSYLIFDGLKTIGVGNVSDGGTLDGRASSTWHDNTFRHMETVGGGSQGLGGIAAFNGLVNITITDNVFHDVGSGGQHCLYLGSRGLASSNLTISRNICYNAHYNGFHLNGRMSAMTVEDNVLYNIEISGISLQEGVNNSAFRRNLIFATANSGVEISNYPGNCAQFGQGGTGEICPYDQINNVFENNTIYATDHNWSSGATTNPRPVTGAYNYSVNQVGDLGHNTFRRNIFVSRDNSHAPIAILYPTGTSPTVTMGYLATDTFSDNYYWFVSGTGSNVLMVLDNGAQAIVFYTCTTAATVTTMTGCNVANPQFTTISTWQTPTAFDFTLQSGSPATGYGAIGATPAGDTTPPVVSFTTPLDGSTTGCNCQFTTSASDNSGAAGITQRLYIDGVLYATQTGATLSHRRRLTRGSHTVWVTATDAANNSSTATITITVQ